MSEDECKPCPGGYYCYKLGAESYDPSLNDTGIELCEAGYYCKLGVDVGTPTNETSTGYGGPCPTGFYCPIQTEDPTPCPTGTYR